MKRKAYMHAWLIFVFFYCLLFTYRGKAYDFSTQIKVKKNPTAKEIMVEKVNVAVAQMSFHDLKKITLNKDLINGNDQYGNFPLMAAVLTNNLEFIEYLLKNGASPNKTLENGVSPWMYAAFNDQPTVLILLAKYKANLQEQFKGLSALDMAEMSGNFNSAIVLKHLGVKGQNLSEKLGYPKSPMQIKFEDPFLNPAIRNDYFQAGLSKKNKNKNNSKKASKK